MALAGDDRGDSQAPRDQLEDARKRRQRRATPRNSTRRAKPRGSGERPPAADARRHALDIANSVRSRDSELGSSTASASADEILAEHQAASELARPADQPPSTSRKNEPAADAILLALQEHDQRAQPSGAPAAPRGSAELEKAQPRATRRPRPTPRRRRGEQKLPSARRILAGVGVIAIIMATSVIVIAAGASSAPNIAAHRFADATKPGAGALVEAADMTLGVLVRDLRAASKPPAHTRRHSEPRRPRRGAPVRSAAHHASNPAGGLTASYSPPATQASPAASQTQDSTAAQTTPVVIHEPVVTPTTSSPTRAQAPTTSSSSSSTGARNSSAGKSANSNTDNYLPLPGGPPPP